MIVNFPFHEIFGKNPTVVAKLFKIKGINPGRPYRARISFDSIIIEQDDQQTH
jgi:hypothetical protein